ncbi:hypothetical protein ZOSMA_57G00120 [Zostera marina]|uniref:HTH OST-type domain-containing protein n=1 Tax=Zostera marina TaxID=29655 RepID=A0A0K9NXB8_ZOSMR|nr:hypothetical protein ZOSMA_57G00120 [Zostera marina]
MSSITPPPHFSSPPSLQTRHSSSESTNRNGEEEGKAVKITVWWDIENCPIPTGVDPYQVAKRITSALRFNGINGPITITAYGNMLQFNPVTCDALFTTGVALKYVPNCGKNSADRSILADLVYWVAQNPPPAHFFLISGDGDFASILHRLRMSNYNVLLASGSSNGSVALSGAATIIWSWDVLVRGASYTGKHSNHPPDGLNGSWYGLCQDSDDSDVVDGDVDERENKLPAIPLALVRKISEILSSNPNGISINALSIELRKSRVPLDRHYYGYSKLSSLVSSLSNIAIVKQHPEFQYDLMAYSAIVGAPNLSRCIQNTPFNFKQNGGKPTSKPLYHQTLKNSEVYFVEMHGRITQDHN